MRFILLDAEQAETVRGETADGSFLEPREVLAGDHAGQFVLGTAVLTDPDHSEHHDLLASCPQANIAPATAWPPEPE